MIYVYIEMLFKYMFIFLQNIFKIQKYIGRKYLLKYIFKYFCPFLHKINVCTVGFRLDFDIAIQTGYCHPENSNL